MLGKYTDSHLDGFLKILRGHQKGESAQVLEEIQEEMGVTISWGTLKETIRRRTGLPPSAYMKGAATSKSAPAPAPRADRPPLAKPALRPGHLDDDMRRLVDATKKGPVPFEELCDQLDMSPKRLRALIERARAARVTVDAAHGHVAFRPPEPTGSLIDTGIRPVMGGRQMVGVITDTHLGSKYCMRAQLRDFIEQSYERGVREILHVGDVIDGKYRHGMFEVTHAGIEDQTQDLFEVLPRLKGLSYHGISGNHDDTFADDAGMSPGDYMQWYFQHHGRDDLHFYGRRGAYLKIRGAIVELWHPRKSGAYSLSYHLQNHIRDYAVGQKPDVLLAGHWHTFVYLEQRGVHALACGTFQGSGSAFSKSLGGAPSIGGTILSWELTQARTLRRFSVERFSYYEKEEVRALELA